MSFTKKTNEKFASVFAKADWVSDEPIVDIQYDAKGKNIIFGRQVKNEDFSNLLYLGKCIERSPGTSFLDHDAWLDTTFPHVIYITGTRGSGKSFDLGVILEGISELNSKSLAQNDVEPITSFLIDTQSQFWTLQYEPNQNIPENKQQLEMLKKWNIPANSLKNCVLYIPKGHEKITGKEKEFQLSCDSIEQEEWCSLIDEEPYSPQGHILSVLIDELKKNFSIKDMIAYLKDDELTADFNKNSVESLTYKLHDLEKTNLFAATGMDIKSMIKPNTSNIFMLRSLNKDVDKSLVAGLVARQLFTIMGEYQNKKKVGAFFEKKMDMEELPNKVWLLIDEAHVIAPSTGSSPAKSALIQYVKRGRDAGLSLVLATQQPSAVDDQILGQVNISLSHRLTFESDIEACRKRIPTKPTKNVSFRGTKLKDMSDSLRLLKAGECFIGDHHTSRTVLISVRPRITSHGGYSPK